MKKVLCAAIAASMLSSTALAQSDETTNYGAVWTGIGVSKSLPHNLSLDIDAGYRTLDWLDHTNRFDAGVGLNYKISKYFKLGLSYTFIRRHYMEETEYKYKGDNDFSSYQGLSIVDDDGLTRDYRGMNVDAANWASRHRVALELTADKRFWKTLRVSLRERHQYTYQYSRDINRTKYRDFTTDQNDNITSYDEITETTKTKDSWKRHLLRSRLKLSIDRKRWKWEPFTSFEIHNNMTDSWHFDKLRITAGAEYAITKQHRITAAYVFTHENDDDGNENIHAISIGYNFKF